MDMTAKFLGSNPAENRFSLTGTCPHCRAVAMFQMANSSYLPPERQQVPVKDSAGKTWAGYEVWALMECQSCRDFICGCVRKATDDRKITVYDRHYPVGWVKNRRDRPDHRGR